MIVHEIGKVYDAPRPCPKCGCKKAKFLTTATDYGEWWECVRCKEVFSTIEPPVILEVGELKSVRPIENLIILMSKKVM